MVESFNGKGEEVRQKNTNRMDPLYFVVGTLISRGQTHFPIGTDLRVARGGCYRAKKTRGRKEFRKEGGWIEKLREDLGRGEGEGLTENKT